MANYVKTTDFAAKDALPTGNALKLARGAQIDAEFVNIATAIATKEDVNNRGQANGYASLDSSGDVPSAQISAASVAQHQGNITIVETQITDGTLLARNAANETISGTWNFSSIPTILGVGVNNAAMLTAGTLPDARVAVGNVTQHQASLGTEAATGSTLARRNSNGYLFATYFNQSSTAETPTIGNMIVESGSDGYFRKTSTAHTIRSLMLSGGVTIQADPGGTPSGTPGQIFWYY